jgi:hypothetical protein
VCAFVSAHVCVHYVTNANNGNTERAPLNLHSERGGDGIRRQWDSEVPASIYGLLFRLQGCMLMSICGVVHVRAYA